MRQMRAAMWADQDGNPVISWKKPFVWTSSTRFRAIDQWPDLDKFLLHLRHANQMARMSVLLYITIE